MSKLLHILKTNINENLNTFQTFMLLFLPPEAFDTSSELDTILYA